MCANSINSVEDELNALAEFTMGKLGAGSELEISFRQKASHAAQLAREVAEMKLSLSALRSIRKEKQ